MGNFKSKNCSLCRSADVHERESSPSLLPICEKDLQSLILHSPESDVSSLALTPRVSKKHSRKRNLSPFKLLPFDSLLEIYSFVPQCLKQAYRIVDREASGFFRVCQKVLWIEGMSIAFYLSARKTSKIGLYPNLQTLRLYFPNVTEPVVRGYTNHSAGRFVLSENSVKQKTSNDTAGLSEVTDVMSSNLGSISSAFDATPSCTSHEDKMLQSQVKNSRYVLISVRDALEKNNMPQLEEIDIRHVQSVARNEFYMLFQQIASGSMIQLQQVSLFGCEMTFDFVKQLGEMIEKDSVLPELNHLSLAGNQLTDNHFKCLWRSICKSNLLCRGSVNLRFPRNNLTSKSIVIMMEALSQRAAMKMREFEEYTVDFSYNPMKLNKCTSELFTVLNEDYPFKYCYAPHLLRLEGTCSRCMRGKDFCNVAMFGRAATCSRVAGDLKRLLTEGLDKVFGTDQYIFI